MNRRLHIIAFQSSVYFVDLEITTKAYSVHGLSEKQEYRSIFRPFIKINHRLL